MTVSEIPYRGGEVPTRTYVLFQPGTEFDAYDDVGSFIEGFCDSMDVQDNMCVVTTSRPIETLLSGIKNRGQGGSEVRLFEVLREIK